MPTAGYVGTRWPAHGTERSLHQSSLLEKWHVDMTDAPWYQVVRNQIEVNESVCWIDVKQLVLDLDRENDEDKDSLISSPWSFDPFINMTRGQIKDHAFELAAKYKDVPKQLSGFPLDLNPLLTHLDINVVYKTMTVEDQTAIFRDRYQMDPQSQGEIHVRRNGNQLLGYLFKPDYPGRVQMFINSACDPTRQLFTTAHELGHYMQWFHIGPQEKHERWDVMACVDYAAQPERVDIEREEIFADAFGRAILIPADDLVVRLADNSILQIADRYGVSVQTAVHRMIDVDKLTGPLAMLVGNQV